MITFQQLCEHLTCNQKHAWFLFEPDYYSALTNDEKALVKIGYISDYLTLYYPVDKFYDRPVGRDEYTKLINEALEKEDYNEIKKLKRMKVYD